MDPALMEHHTHPNPAWFRKTTLLNDCHPERSAGQSSRQRRRNSIRAKSKDPRSRMRPALSKLVQAGDQHRALRAPPHSVRTRSQRARFWRDGVEAGESKRTRPATGHPTINDRVLHAAGHRTPDAVDFDQCLRPTYSTNVFVSGHDFSRAVTTARSALPHCRRPAIALLWAIEDDSPKRKRTTPLPVSTGSS
jgi:hypothetical protein